MEREDDMRKYLTLILSLLALMCALCDSVITPIACAPSMRLRTTRSTNPAPRVMALAQVSTAVCRQILCSLILPHPHGPIL